MRVLTPEDRVRRGRGAEILLADPDVEFVFAEMSAALHHQLDNQPTDDVDNILSIVRQLRVIKALKCRLEGFVQEGKRASTELEVEAKRRGSNVHQI